MSSVECPWDYALAPAPGSAVVPNPPSSEGAELGRHLARFVDVEDAARTARGEPVLPRCHDCAFSSGSVPNACLPTVMTALKCVLEHEEFSCHHGLAADGEPSRACAGWLTLEGAK